MAAGLEAEMLKHLTEAATAANIDDATGAALGCIAYRGLWDLVPAGWNELARANDHASGYDGIAFHHPASRSLVVASRGVDGFRSKKDWLVSGAMALGLYRGQAPLAVDLLRRAWAAAPQGQVDRLFLAGHSLGGGMADALCGLGRSALAPQGFGDRPISGLGIASAGFSHAARAYAAQAGLTVNEADGDAIRHFIRKEDAVPHHPGRAIFGRDNLIASVYTGSFGQSGKWPQAMYSWVADWLDNHQQLLHFKFLTEPDSRHVWRNAAGAYDPRDGGRPAWKKPRQMRPDDF
ncbi:MAG: hypothetical protein V4597_00205 [Pseudomonadota bacterium]